MAHDKDRQPKATETWAEVFTALDAANVNEGFVVERDARKAEERPALDAFFAGEEGSAQEK
jgi:hypothetical protein